MNVISKRHLHEDEIEVECAAGYGSGPDEASKSSAIVSIALSEMKAIVPTTTTRNSAS